MSKSMRPAGQRRKRGNPGELTFFYVNDFISSIGTSKDATGGLRPPFSPRYSEVIIGQKWPTAKSREFLLSPCFPVVYQRARNFAFLFKNYPGPNSPELASVGHGWNLRAAWLLQKPADVLAVSAHHFIPPNRLH